MKLLIYRISLITLLTILFGVGVSFLILNIMNIVKLGQIDFDHIIYILCFVLCLAFLGLEIFNTCLSFKTGSNFIKNLVYDDDLTLNKRFILLVRIGIILSLGIMIYSIIICFQDSLFLSNLDLGSKELIILFSSIIFVDFLAIGTYQFFDKADTDN